MADVAFALVLNLHQPAYNLEDLLERQEWEAREILWAIDRIPRSLWAYEDVGRVHLSVSGTLLETLASPGFQRRVYGIVDCGSLLWYLQNTKIIRILGTGYYHPVLPLIPRADCDEQLERWQGIGQHLFARTSFPGFWPPEMGFCMELIPALNRQNYRYVLVDSEHVEAVTPMSWDELRYRPHIATVRGRRNHRRGARPGALRRPGDGDGRRLVHSRGVPTDQALQLPAPGDHLHRWRERRLVPQHLTGSQLLAVFYQDLLRRTGTTGATASIPASSTTTSTATVATARSLCARARGIPAGTTAPALSSGSARRPSKRP